MKRLLCCLFALSLLFGCTQTPIETSSSVSASSSQESLSETAFSPALPESFSLTYATTAYNGEEATAYQTVICRDKDATLCYVDNDPAATLGFYTHGNDLFESYTYDPATDKLINRYEELVASLNSVPTDEEVGEGELVDSDTINVLVSAYTHIMTQHMSCASKLTYVENAIVAGRECRVYRLKREDMGNLKNLFYDALYYVDTEYDLLLQYTVESADKDGAVEYICTSFAFNENSFKTVFGK